MYYFIIITLIWDIRLREVETWGVNRQVSAENKTLIGSKPNKLKKRKC